MYGHVQHGEELNRPNPVRKEFLRTTSLRILNTDGLNNLKYVATQGRILGGFYKHSFTKLHVEKNTDGLNNLKYVASAKTKFCRIL
jgi:hypothetical protein